MPLRMSQPRIATAEFRTVRMAPKQVDPHYHTPEHRAWAELVVKRAGARCEAVDDTTGQRCTKAGPEHRMFADHISERRDNGSPYDPANGQCLCGSHHTRKTAAERAKRAGERLTSL